MRKMILKHAYATYNDQDKSWIFKLILETDWNALAAAKQLEIYVCTVQIWES